MIDFDSLAGKSRADIFLALDASEEGLSEGEARARQARYGKNQIVFHRPKSPMLMLLGEFRALFPLLLLAASLLAFFANTLSPASGYDLIGMALFGVVVLNALVSFFQNYKVEKLMLSFLDYIPKMVVLLRDGQKVKVDAQGIVPGDILFIQEGDKISADGIVLDTSRLLVDESILTGESQPLSKSVLLECVEKQCQVFSGSTVLKGNGRVLVLKTGRSTNLGTISMLSQRVQQELTPMQRELKAFAGKITWLATGIGLFFFLIGTLIGNPFWTNLVFAIGIIVANVPEGLLPTVTLALTQSSMRMSRRNAVVKDILSVETLGSTTVICTDKTGTLTQNKLQCEQFYLGFNQLEASRVTEYLQHPDSQRLTEIMGLCNDLMVTAGEEGSITFSGDPTEIAMAEFVEACGGYEELHERFLPVTSQPFDPLLKYMSSTWRRADGSLLMTVKGAAEILLERCTEVLHNGSVRPLTAEEGAALKQQARRYSEEGLRVLGLAYRIDREVREEVDHLVFTALVAMIDPPRAEVPAAVKACKEAGIRILVLSGDTPGTVCSIARRVGIAGNPRVVEGPELSRMSQDELATLLKIPEIVFARIDPEQKLTIVGALKEMGEVVAVTGDGVNDAPALKRADIGIAMGLRGTDVAREASDIILLDDNFATIVHAIEEGRGVYENIKKFIVYVLTSNIPEILPYIAYLLLPIPLPITVIQILSVDLFTDMLPAIGLGNEPPEPDTMRLPPRAAHERLVTFATFQRSYGLLGPVESLIAFAVFFTILFRGGWSWGAVLPPASSLYREASGAFLAAIIFGQIGNVMACRTSRQSGVRYLLRNNMWITAGITLEVLFIFSVIYLPGLHLFFNTAPLPAASWPGILAAPFLVFGVEELRKLFSRKCRRGS